MELYLKRKARRKGLIASNAEKWIFEMKMQFGNNINFLTPRCNDLYKHYGNSFYKRLCYILSINSFTCLINSCLFSFVAAGFEWIVCTSAILHFQTLNKLRV